VKSTPDAQNGAPGDASHLGKKDMADRSRPPQAQSVLKGLANVKQLL
jgi:hypothetical protein